MTNDFTVYKGRAPHGMEILVTIYDDGDAEIAFRRGPDEPINRWGPPIPLVKEERNAQGNGRQDHPTVQEPGD